MPYVNYHNARIAPPSDFRKGSFRTIRQTVETGRNKGKTLLLILAKRKGSKLTSSMALQSIRYPKSEWSQAAALSSAKRSGAILFEPAKTKTAKAVKLLERRKAARKKTGKAPLRKNPRKGRNPKGCQ